MSTPVPQPIQILLDKLALSDPGSTVTNWFEQFCVDCYTEYEQGSDEHEKHGFPLPARDPDGTWQPLDCSDLPVWFETKIAFWLEGEEVLGLARAEDSVASYEHYHWYRIPISAIPKTSTGAQERFLVQNTQGVDQDLDERTFAERSILGFVEVPSGPSAPALAWQKIREVLGLSRPPAFLLSWDLASDIEKAVAQQRGEITSREEKGVQDGSCSDNTEPF